MAGTGTRLDGKVALVTGAASGVGRATAKIFAAEGAKVVGTDIDDVNGAALVDEIKADGGEAIYVHANVRNYDDLVAAVAAAEETFGRLDICIANAGTVGGNAVGRPMEDLSEEQWVTIVDINLHGVYRTFRAAIPALRRAGGGAFSSTASIAGLTGVAGQSAYSASKGGIIALVRSLAYQLAGDHIRVNCVCPGGINTNLLAETDLMAILMAQAADGPPMGAPVEAAPGADPVALMNQAADPEDIANAHLYLVSDEARMVNGQSLVVDAGSMVANMWLVVPRDQ
ncbi:MAG: hypothetical protein JWN46_3287 [Acidimicrobiales bacterium]|nr:hypothetical protein [Acidimicrobiales bacterium]